MALAFGYGSFMADSWKSVWAYSALNLLFGWILLMMRDRVFFPRVVENGALTYLGKISYGLYVYHFAVIWLTSRTARALFPGSPGIRRLLVIVGALGLTIAISMISYAIVEVPFLRSEGQVLRKAPGRRAHRRRGGSVCVTIPGDMTGWGGRNWHSRVSSQSRDSEQRPIRISPCTWSPPPSRTHISWR